MKTINSRRVAVIRNTRQIEAIINSSLATLRRIKDLRRVK